MMLSSTEADGVVRKLPLVVRVPSKEPTDSAQIFPSIPTEIVRVLAGDISYQMKLGDAGVEAVRIPQFSTIKTDANGSIYVDYKYKVQEFAFDNLPDFNGGIVILSLTASGLDNTIATPVGRSYDHDLIAASVYTIVNGINISRPWWSDIGELATALAISLTVMILVLKLNWYFGVGGIVVSLGGISSEQPIVRGTEFANSYATLLDALELLIEAISKESMIPAAASSATLILNMIKEINVEDSTKFPFLSNKVKTI